MSRLSSLLNTSNTPRLERELLLAYILQKPREFLIAHPELNISKIQETRYKYLLWKLKRGYPLAYLTGHREFYGLDFLVNKYTLVPRPETELMVELVIEKIFATHYPVSQQGRRSEDQKIVLIDVGTGSGCIPISIMKTISHVILSEAKDPDPTQRSFGLQPQDGVPQTSAIDISKGALKLAKKNAKRHNLGITFLHGNLLEPFTQKNRKQLEIGNLELVITSNLPYLTKEQFNNEPSIQKEPHSALVADDNGLALYKQLLNQITLLVTRYKLHVTLFMEIDPTQKDTLTAYCTEYFSTGTIKIYKDLLGHDRIVSLNIQKNRLL